MSLLDGNPSYFHDQIPTSQALLCLEDAFEESPRGLHRVHSGALRGACGAAGAAAVDARGAQAPQGLEEETLQGALLGAFGRGAESWQLIWPFDLGKYGKTRGKP